jgi:radical SAM superfamily enzyme YgiQ (UPF0313 family)
MRILLINPNQYRFPPVIPLALEYLAGALEQSGHEYRILDLCFSAEPERDLRKAILDHKPDLAGITVRQIDTVLYQNNEFFLDRIKDFVQVIHAQGLKVVLGGAGFSIMPQAALDYTGADWGIFGPGENALVVLMDQLGNGRAEPGVRNGYQRTRHFGCLRKKVIDYTPYLNNQGIVGFRTSSGCTEGCFFCTEGGKKLIFHTPEATARELAELRALGHVDFHLCDSEFNQNIKHCLAVCRAVRRYAPGIRWSLYMKPEPFSAELFGLLRESGAQSITLSLDARFMRNRRLPGLKHFFALAAREGIKVAVDLSLGGPGESPVAAGKCIDFLDSVEAATVGINTYYRVYPGTPLYQAVMKNRNLQKKLIRPGRGSGFLQPVFFNRLSETVIAGLIAGKAKFRIEGSEMLTNYQRVGNYVGPSGKTGRQGAD